MLDNLYKISIQEYLEKANDTVVDGKTDKDYRITINKYLSSLRRPTRNYLDYSDMPTISRRCFINDSNYLRVYDHVKDFRIKIPNSKYPNSIRCAFSSPYNEVHKVKEYMQEPWIKEGYKIYLVNPRLYRYYKMDTVTLAHVEDLNKNSWGRTTNYIANLINYYMVIKTGEPLFYLI